YGANLAEKVESLIDLALRIGRVGTLLRGRAAGELVIAGVVGSIAVAIAHAAARIPYRTAGPIAEVTRLSSTGLTTSVAWVPLIALITLAGLAGLPGLTRLTGLPGLPVAAELARLALSTLR